MAKELDKFKTEWKKVQKAVEASADEIRKNAQSLGQTTGVRNEGCLQLGLEIQRCKDEGMQGKSVDDFKSDPDVKSCLKSIEGFQAQIEKEINRITALHKKDFAASMKQYWDMRKRLKEEVDKRDKKKNRKVAAVDSKSLPDLQKMLKEVVKYEDSGIFSSIAFFQPETVKAHQDELARKLKEAVTQAKDVKLSKFQLQMAQQGLDERVIKNRLAAAQKIYKTVVGHCMVAQEAIKARQNDHLMKNKALAAQEFKNLKTIVEPYLLAQKDAWIRSKYKGNSKIEKSLAAFNKMFEEARSELQTIANVRLDS